jgi:ABC-2 type transport system ATP-binding protein
MTAVDDVTATIFPGRVTGFLGPNGAGKSTTMRLILGLDRPDAGEATVRGRRLADLPAPITEVGALLDARAVPGGRSGRDHLLALAATHGIGRRRVGQVLELCGLGAAARRPVREYSLGMSQRLGIAAAILGDPHTLILDEPVNGLDPEGVLWIRSLVRHLAREGRTIFLSSHLMSEMAQTADHLVVIGQGRLLADQPIGDFLRAASGTATRVRSPQAAAIARAFAAHPGVSVTIEGPDEIVLHGVEPLPVGEAAAAHGWVILELAPVTSSLEDAYLQVTEDAVDYRSAALV